MLDRLQAWMASLSPKRNGEASLAIWVLGSVMTCLAVAFPLLGDNNINNYLFVTFSSGRLPESLLSQYEEERMI